MARHVPLTVRPDHEFLRASHGAVNLPGTSAAGPRIIAGAAVQFDEIVLYREGHRRVKLALAARSTAWTRDGLLGSIDAEDDADLFLYLPRAGLYEKRLLGIASPPSAEQIASRVARAVQVFLHGITVSRG